MSRISNVTNIPTIKIHSLINNKEYFKNKTLTNIFYDIMIYFYVFFFIFSKNIIEKKEHIFDFLSSQGITFNNNNLSWIFIFLIHFLPSFLISFSNVNLYEDNKLKMLINQLSFNIDIFFIYSLILIFILNYRSIVSIHFLIILILPFQIILLFISYFIDNFFIYFTFFFLL